MSKSRNIRWSLVPLYVVFAYLVVLRLWFDLAVAPMGDEAYYWMWGQHLSWSYFDHPPLDGWLQGFIAAIFGWSSFSVRLLTWVSLAGSLAVLWLWSGRLAPDDRTGWFWHSTVIYLTIPVIFTMSSFAFHDHLLLVLVLAASYAFYVFATDWEAGLHRWRWLFAAAFLLGLATLTKYNGVLLGVAFALWVLCRPKLRGLYLTPQLWLAAVLAIAIQAPVIYWNLTEGMVSFRFHLTERPLLDWAHPNIKQVFVFLGDMVLLMSPVLFLSLFRIPFMRSRSDAEGRAVSLATTTYLTSTLAWTAIALYLFVYFHWNIGAYTALAPIAYRLIGGRIAMWLHIAFGLIVITFGVLNYAVGPTKLFGFGDAGTAANFGWPELAARVEAQHATYPGSFLAAARYTYAAQLGFQLHDIDVAALNHLRSQNDYWWNATAHTGQDAIIVADSAEASTIAEAAPHFASVRKLEDVPVISQGKTIWTFEIWLGTGFHP